MSSVVKPCQNRKTDTGRAPRADRAARRAARVVALVGRRGARRGGDRSARLLRWISSPVDTTPPSRRPRTRCSSGAGAFTATSVSTRTPRQPLLRFYRTRLTLQVRARRRSGRRLPAAGHRQLQTSPHRDAQDACRRGERCPRSGASGHSLQLRGECMGAATVNRSGIGSMCAVCVRGARRRSVS